MKPREPVRLKCRVGERLGHWLRSIVLLICNKGVCMGKTTEQTAYSRNESGGRRLNLPSVGAVLTAREACDYLRISKWTLYRLIRSGQIKTMKIGSRRLVRRQS